MAHNPFLIILPTDKYVREKVIEGKYQKEYQFLAYLDIEKEILFCIKKAEKLHKHTEGIIMILGTEVFKN